MQAHRHVDMPWHLPTHHPLPCGVSLLRQRLGEGNSDIKPSAALQIGPMAGEWLREKHSDIKL